LKPDFWLLGEVVHGDYRKWANTETLDSVTNYECYKGLYSSHADRNYFEIAWSLDRQFGPAGLYRGLPLYAFADNHDVDRVASMVKEPRHLFSLYCLLFTMPGLPSVYYGSEWGLAAKKDGSDWPFRPQLDLAASASTAPRAELAEAIRRLAGVRQACAPLRTGDYGQLSVSHEQLAFARRNDGHAAVVVVNASAEAAPARLEIPGVSEANLVDLLNPGEEFRVSGGKVVIPAVPSGWARIMEVRS
ncbi:MAG TPA: alpha-amylase family glycosyl hydrolase, partial [Spirochaetia bacterium]|nr:alpha-amylase family glycosyl hydrolase [Spirochaetia bacterium]